MKLWFFLLIWIVLISKVWCWRSLKLTLKILEFFKLRQKFTNAEFPFKHSVIFLSVQAVHFLVPSPGQCQFCEPTGLANVADIFHVNTVGQLLMSFDVSSSKQALAFGDSSGCVHLWSDVPEVSFNDYSRETDFPLPCLVDTLPQLDWNHDLLPLSLIPVPLTSTEPLLSDWPTPLSTPSPR